MSELIGGLTLPFENDLIDEEAEYCEAYIPHFAPLDQSFAVTVKTRHYGLLSLVTFGLKEGVFPRFRCEICGRQFYLMQMPPKQRRRRG